MNCTRNFYQVSKIPSRVNVPCPEFLLAFQNPFRISPGSPSEISRGIYPEILEILFSAFHWFLSVSYENVCKKNPRYFLGIFLPGICFGFLMDLHLAHSKTSLRSLIIIIFSRETLREIPVEIKSFFPNNSGSNPNIKSSGVPWTHFLPVHRP